MNQPVVFKTRFAPSPSGQLHLGNVRTALFSFLWARQTGGVFLLRIEDTDAERSQERYTEALLADLQWLGIRWQEGPGAGGDSGPYLQSLRRVVYNRHLEQLEAAGLTYPCYCSPRELALSRKAQLESGRPPRYAGTCAGLSERQRNLRREQGLVPSIRFRVPGGREIRFDDLVRGEQCFMSDGIGDFIICRADGAPQFFFANAVDDARMGVTHVLRGEDHLANTPRQLMLLEALGLPAPRYGHLGMIVGDDGAPLSKRNGSQSVAELRDRGYRPEAVVNYLARLGHSYVDDAWRGLDALAAGFDPERLGRAPARFDPVQLDHWQSEAVRRMDRAALGEWLAPALEDRVAGELLGPFLKAVQPNIRLPADAVFWARRLIGDPPAPAAPAAAIIAEAGHEYYEAAASAAVAGAGFPALVARLGEVTGRKGRSLFMPLRAALTGEVHGPELAAVYDLLGPTAVAERLRMYC